jgi:hypothetical protein
VIARSHRKSVYQPRPASRTKCRSFPFISLTIRSPLDTLMPTRVKEAQPAPPLAGKRLRSTIQFQRTANSVLTACPTPGDNPRSSRQRASGQVERRFLPSILDRRYSAQTALQPAGWRAGASRAPAPSASMPAPGTPSKCSPPKKPNPASAPSFSIKPQLPSSLRSG